MVRCTEPGCQSWDFFCPPVGVQVVDFPSKCIAYSLRKVVPFNIITNAELSGYGYRSILYVLP